jgi:glycosyltransferase involved in cell wall biosynthesis
MKSILLINYEYPPIGGGAANATYHLARNLAADPALRVTVLTARYGDLPRELTVGNLTVVRCPALRRRADRSGMIEKLSFVIGAAKALPGIIRTKEIDGSIAFFTLPCGPIALRAFRLFGIPYIVSLRGGDVPGIVPELGIVHRITARLRRAVLQSARAVIANSEGLRKAAEAADPFSVGVIPNGVDVEFFSPPERKNAREHCNILFVGRLHEQKNLFLLLDQFARIVTREKTPRATLHLVGDGPLRKKLEETSARLGIARSVVWHGWLDKEKLAGVYRHCDCFVNPSTYEGSPNTVLEAMACGLPVVASDSIGNNELIAHGTTGLLFDLSKPDALGACLESQINDPVAAGTMGLAARRWVIEHHSWTIAAERYRELLRS